MDFCPAFPLTGVPKLINNILKITQFLKQTNGNKTDAKTNLSREASITNHIAGKLKVFLNNNEEPSEVGKNFRGILALRGQEGSHFIEFMYPFWY